jgi:hypothetical protein
LTLDTLDIVLLLAGTALQAVLLALVSWRRVFRTLPVFFAYQIWCLCSTSADFAAVHWPWADYQWFYLLNISIDETFQLAILFELGRRVLRYNRAAPPSRAVFVFLLVLAGLLIFSMARWTVPSDTQMIWQFGVHLQQIFSILPVASLLALAWWCSLQSLRWPATELHVASGLGFYFIVALAVSILHTHQPAGPLYHWLNQISAASYLGTLAYWVLSFATKEENLQNFSSQM